jgi:tetratricopeptide (TPR) repeat protein
MSGTGRRGAENRRRDQRPLAFALVASIVVMVGLGIHYYPAHQQSVDAWPSEQPLQGPAEAVQSQVEREPASSSPAGVADPLRQRLDMHFQRAVVMLHAKEYRHALVALDEVLTMAPKMPEAYVNSGYALIGLEQFENAAEAFLQAIDLHPEQANAYYGLAIALDALGNRIGAIGAMYSFLHRAPEDDPYRRKAAAALWEWQSERADEEQSRTQLPGPLVGQKDGKTVD